MPFLATRGSSLLSAFHLSAAATRFKVLRTLCHRHRDRDGFGKRSLVDGRTNVLRARELEMTLCGGAGFLVFYLYVLVRGFEKGFDENNN